MIKLTLRKKLLFFSIILALIPLTIAGSSMIRITQDELKSFLNDELIFTADQLAQEIDNLYAKTWLAPLFMMKRVVESDEFDAQGKVAFLKNIRDISDIRFCFKAVCRSMQLFKSCRTACIPSILV